jgi:hypothetical protein
MNELIRDGLYFLVMVFTGVGVAVMMITGILLICGGSNDICAEMKGVPGTSQRKISEARREQGKSQLAYGVPLFVVGLVIALWLL